MSKRHRPPKNAFRSFRGKPFELLNALAQVVGKPSLIGDIATTLYDKHSPLLTIVDSPVVNVAIGLRRAPWPVLGAAVSSIRLPSDRVWLEFVHDGIRMGLLAENLPSGTVRVRRAQFLRGGAVGTPTMCVSVRPEKTRRAEAWQDDRSWLKSDPAEDARWERWFDDNVWTLYSREQPSLEEDVAFLAAFGLPDLALLATACSPLVASAWVQFMPDGSVIPVAEGLA